MTSLYKRIGLIFTTTGGLHTLLGIILFHAQLRAIYGAGIVNGIEEHYDRGFSFWFVFTGLLMMLLGFLMDWVVRKKQLILPKSFGYLLVALCLVGAIIMPVGGFWLALLQGVYIASQANKEPKSHSLSTN